MELQFALSEIEIAAKFIQQSLGKNRIIAFTGEMGAGKTTLSQEFCKKLGVTANMSSPTFSIINEYGAQDGSVIYHMDLYRLKDEEEAIAAGVEECLFSGRFCLVEWPEIIDNLLGDDCLRLQISLAPDNKRLLKIL